MSSLDRLVLSALFCVPLCFADSIVGGWIHTFPHPYPGAEFHLIGQDFEVHGFTEWGIWPSIGSIPPDGLVQTSGGATTIDGGPATVKGRYYPNLLLDVMDSWPPSQMYVEGPAVLIKGPGTYTAPFTSHGFFCAIVPPPHTTGEGGFYVCDFLIGLTGRGTVSLFVDEWNGGLRVSSASYDFANIPEASSIGLAMIGLGGVWVVRWWRSRGGRCVRSAS